jgi:hypothetical protein
MVCNVIVLWNAINPAYYDCNFFESWRYQHARGYLRNLDSESARLCPNCRKGASVNRPELGPSGSFGSLKDPMIPVRSKDVCDIPLFGRDEDPPTLEVSVSERTNTDPPTQLSDIERTNNTSQALDEKPASNSPYLSHTPQNLQKDPGMIFESLSFENFQPRSTTFPGQGTFCGNSKAKQTLLCNLPKRIERTSCYTQEKGDPALGRPLDLG